MGVEADGADRAAAIADVLRVGSEFARDVATRLHDGPVQVLTAASLRLGIVPLQEHPPTPEELAEITGLVNQSLAEVRAVMDELRPPDDVADTTAGAMRVVVARRGFTGHLDVVDVGTAVPPPVAALYSLVVRQVFADATPAQLEGAATIELGVVGDTARLRVELEGDEPLSGRVGPWVRAFGGTLTREVGDGRTHVAVETPLPR